MDGTQIAFYAFSALVIVGALLTITRKNAVGAVMSLVGTFFGLAALYALLYAHFLAALQVLVYAGAIMVLFIFVVMVLNRDEIHPFSTRGVGSKLAMLLGIGSIAYLGAQLGSKLLYVTVSVSKQTGAGTFYADPPKEDFGTVASVGHILFTDYLFAFEAVSILLLIAVVAAVVVARSPRSGAYEEPEPPRPVEHAGGHH